MNQIIIAVALIVVACGYAHAKCDAMKDLKEEFDEIKTWGQLQCEKSKTFR